jgi:ABC-type phosphonate transport system ATPase subunit
MQTTHLEVLRVGPGFLINARDDGYYLAVRAGTRLGEHRDTGPRFYGPFSTAAQASFLAVSAHALGLT